MRAAANDAALPAADDQGARKAARVGSLIASPEIVALLTKVIPPYSIPQLAIEAVLATLEPPQLAVQRERVAQVRARAAPKARIDATY